VGDSDIIYFLPLWGNLSASFNFLFAPEAGRRNSFNVQGNAFTS
jgi:hypothetical protein